MPTDITAALTPDGTPWIPAFPSQRPPFAPGNTAALGNSASLLHGAYSLRHVEPLARALVKEMLTEPELDYLHAPRFTAALWDWGRAEARSQLVEVWIAGMSMTEATDTTGGKTSPMELALELGIRAGNHADRLGLSPAAAEEHADEIAKARKTLARRAGHKALHDDLIEAARESWHPND